MLVSLGYVTGTAGTPTRITQNAVGLGLITSAGDPFYCHSVFIQQVRTNSGYVLVGSSHLNESTGVDLDFVLAIPTSNSLPNAAIGISDAANAMDASEFFVDFTHNGDKALVSALIL